MAMKGNYHNLERIVKGFANHRRLRILELLQREPELSVVEIARVINTDLKNASEHIRRMAIAGLVLKRSSGKYVRHRLTPLAAAILKFLRQLS